MRKFFLSIITVAILTGGLFAQPLMEDESNDSDISIKAKAGVEVIEGTHPYKPDKIFA